MQVERPFRTQILSQLKFCSDTPLIYIDVLMLGKGTAEQSGQLRHDAIVSVNGQ